MNYILKGNLRAFYCGDCFDYLYKAKVKIYSVDKSGENTIAYAVAPEKETFHQRSEEELKSLSKRLLFETETDEMGNFTIELSEKKYNGSAFDIDFECGSVPIQVKLKNPPKPRGPFQFHITTLQPLWREVQERKGTYTAYWEYGITYKFWCWLLRLLGLYVICGRVVDCEKKIPISGLTVKAFDVDLIQDDYLGQGTTNAYGLFKIYYTEADFLKTIFSGINVEWVAGPDLYFSIESSAGIVIMNEPRSRGRQKDRENVSNCFCVELCVNMKIPPSLPVPIPAFLRIGGIDYSTQMHSAPFGDGLTTSNYAFFSSLRLNGILAQTFGGQPMEYCFEFTKNFDGGGAPINWQRVTPAQIGTTKIGIVQKATLENLPVPHYVYNNKDCLVSNVPIAGAITTPVAADGWILVPQQNDNPLDPAGNGMFVANGNQIMLDSKSLDGFPPINLNGLVAGQDTTSTGKPLAQDKVFALRMLVRQQGNDATITEAGMCGRIAVDNTMYTNINHHPEWGAWNSPAGGEYGVCMVDIQQLMNAGCQKITNKVDILYSVAHPNIGSIGLTLKGPMPTITLGPIPAIPNSFGTITHNFTALDPLCAYLVTLTATYLLTTGDSNLHQVEDQIAFCR
ncbi:MAG: hypothetical protein HY960_10640 [Ignavibacteriae bacterium]|nr:hypothetical protein [Ignavibacteriota bacterium]